MKRTLQAICLAVMVMAFGNVFGQDRLIPFSEDGDKYGYKYNESDEVVIKPQYDAAKDFSEGLAAVYIGDGFFEGGWGFINEKGDVVIQLQYSSVDAFSDGWAAARNDEYKWGYINKTGEWVIQPQFDEALGFSEDLAPARVGDWDDGKWGYIDKTGKWVIQPQFVDAKPFWGEIAPVIIDGQWGYINKKGDVVLEPRPEYPLVSQGNVAYANIGGKEMLINKKGKTILEVPDGSDFLWDFNDDWGKVLLNGKYGIINENELLIEPKFDEVEFYGNIAMVTMDGKTGLLNKEVKWIIGLDEGVEFDRPAYKYEGVFKVYQNDKYGYVNENGWLLKPQFDEARDFSEGLAAVKVGGWNGKWGFVDKTGKMVIQPEYDETGDFSEGLAGVRMNNVWEWGFIDKTGKMVIQPKYEGFYKFSEGLAGVKMTNGKWGFIDKTGEWVIQPQFDEASYFESGKSWVLIGDWENGTRGYVDRNGNFTPDEE